MKFAICYRGISYQENYVHEQRFSPYTLDFHDCLTFHRINLLDALREKGHEVDVMFNTYESKKTDEYVDELKPVSVILKPFDANNNVDRFGRVRTLIIETLKQARDHQIANGVKYDFIVLNRFDMVIFDDFSKIFIPQNAISVPTVNDDCFIVISGDLLDRAIEIYEDNRDGRITHNIVHRFLERGVRYHAMYPHTPGDEAGWNGPLYRISRLMFVPDNHNIKEFNLQDVFNKTHRRYGFLHKPNAEFFDCKRPEFRER